MFFVVEVRRLQRMISLTREDQQGDSKGPFCRFEANGNRLKLTGHHVEVEFPATVYEPGVLFLRVTIFHQLLETFGDEKMMAIQVNKDGMMLGNVQLSFDVGDMLLYTDPARAPVSHPDEEPDDATGTGEAQGE